LIHWAEQGVHGAGEHALDAAPILVAPEVQ
jgi:hypothetical protein